MLNDLRYALRHLGKHAGFATIAALTLGLGIALVTTQFSLIDGVLLRPLPFKTAEQLYHVSRAQEGPGGQTWDAFLVEEAQAISTQQQSFDQVASFQWGSYNLAYAGATPRRLQGNAVTSRFFEVTGTQAVMGRAFADGEDRPGQPLTAVLSHALWMDEFAGDPAAIGKAITLNGETGTIIGVMPPGFSFPGRDDLWVNMRLAPAEPDASFIPRVEVVGLLKSGTERGAAELEVATILQRVQSERGKPADIKPVAIIQRVPLAYGGGNTKPLFASMFAMTLFVLLLGCVNVANLLFVRAAERMRELALRNALGAGRGRIVRQLLIESLVLALLGALVGTALAALGVRLLDTTTRSMMELPLWMHFDLNPRVLACTIAVSALAGLTAGLLPALRAGRLDLSAALREDGGGSVGAGPGRAGRYMIVGQIAFACGALVMAVLLATSTVRGSRVNLEFDPEHVLIGRIELQAPAYADAGDRTRFYQRLLDRVHALPGVGGAAVSSRDLVNPGVYSPFELDGGSYARESDRPGAWLEVVSRDYFGMVDRGPLSGRLFGAQDGPDSQPVALVNRSFAERTWPGQDPIGKRLRRGEPGAYWATVVGVVPDLHMQGIGNGNDGPGWYLLQDQMGWGWLDLLVRVDGDPAAMIEAVRTAVAEVDPGLPIHTIGTLGQRTTRALAYLHIVGSMAVVFSVSALVLAAVGIYGVIAFTARRRMREFGVRIALGSTGRGILGLLFRASATQAVAGVAIGLGLGYLLSRPLAPILMGVSASDPLIYGAVALVLVSTAAFACWLPARRAAQVDPVTALRAD